MQTRDLPVEDGLARPRNQMNISLRQTRECTPRGQLKRVPVSEQKRADLVKSLQGTPWDRLARRPTGRPRKTTPRAPPVPTLPLVKESERPSEDASERRSAKAHDLNPPTVPHVIRVFRAGDTENEPSLSSSRPMETEDGERW